jgi:hypothetical protein
VVEKRRRRDRRERRSGGGAATSAIVIGTILLLPDGEGGVTECRVYAFDERTGEWLCEPLPPPQ